jgi:hypothetical protein
MATKQLVDFVTKLEKILQTGKIKRKTGSKHMTEPTEEFANIPNPEETEEVVGIQEEEPEPPRKNLTIAIEGEILTVTVNLGLYEGESRSGRSMVISSSNGNMRLFDSKGFRDEVLNFSVTTRKPGAKPVRWHSYT